MEITIKNKNYVKFLQEGGAMEPAQAPEQAPELAPAPEAGGNPEELIIQAAALAVLTQDALLALQVCQALVLMAGGGGEPAPAAPLGQEPVYKKGGKLSKWILK